MSHGEGSCLTLSIGTTFHYCVPERVSRPEPIHLRLLPKTHMAISNCSIHFRFMSSVLQKNWKPCFPWR